MLGSFARRLAVSPASQSATRSLHVTVPVAGSRQFSPAFWHVEGAPEKKQTPPPAKPVKSDPASGTVPVGQLFHEIQQRAGKGKTPPISMLHSLCASVNEEAHTRLLSDALKLYRNKHTPTRESTATHVVKACFRANAADSALMFFANRPTYALFPSRHTLHLLLFRFAIEAATKPEAAEKATKSYALLNDYGYEPTPFALSLLIRAYVNAGTLDSLTQAVELYKLPNNTILSPTTDDLPQWTSRLIMKIKESPEATEKLLGDFTALLHQWETNADQKLPAGIQTALSS